MTLADEELTDRGRESENLAFTGSEPSALTTVAAVAAVAITSLRVCIGSTRIRTVVGSVPLHLRAAVEFFRSLLSLVDHPSSHACRSGYVANTVEGDPR